MEKLGISLEDATKVMTVSAAFRKAQADGRSTIEAIDELTSRLKLANFLRGGWVAEIILPDSIGCCPSHARRCEVDGGLAPTPSVGGVGKKVPAASEEQQESAAAGKGEDKGTRREDAGEA